MSFVRLLTLSKDEVKSASLWRKYKVEAFKRLTMPLYNFVFALLALSAVLLGVYRRQGNSLRTCIIVGIGLLIQTLELAFDNMAGRNLWFLIFAVANIVIPIFIVHSLFKYEQRKKSHKKGLASLYLQGIHLKNML